MYTSIAAKKKIQSMKISTIKNSIGYPSFTFDRFQAQDNESYGMFII